MQNTIYLYILLFFFCGSFLSSSGVRVALFVDNPMFDGSFNQGCYNGAVEAAEQYNFTLLWWQNAHATANATIDNIVANYTDLVHIVMVSSVFQLLVHEKAAQYLFGCLFG